MPRKKSEVVSGLENKGFHKGTGDHIFLTYFAIDGRKTSVFTKISRGSKNEIDENLLGKMAQQCKLARKRFLDLIDCPMSRNEYETDLRQRDIIR
jgi:hypothetical protein